LEGLSLAENKKQPAKREYTYQVGWKKGKLEIGENGRVTGAESSILFMEKKLWLHMLDRFVWRKTPAMPNVCLTVAVALLPAMIFVLTWALAFLLSRP
jgi:hypothetical protein